ncbi:MAG: lytic transglycosylase domain-containing protein [Pseudomonadota bacterium]
MKNCFKWKWAGWGGALAAVWLSPSLALGATIYVTASTAGGLPSYSDEPTGQSSEVHMRIARPSLARATPAYALNPSSLSRTAIVIDADLRQTVREAALRHAVPEALLLAVIHVESGFNPRAQSPKGAVGLMQVMPPTGARWGVSSDLYNPIKNIGVGARYLRYLLDMFRGNTELALAAYNAGEGAVLRYKRTIPPYAETQAYVVKVLHHYALYNRDKG